VGLYEMFKDVVTVAQKAGNIELMNKLMDVQMEMVRLTEENRDLRTHIRELEEQRTIEGQLTFRNNQCWRRQPNGAEEGPFCPTCWDVDKRLVHLAEGATRGNFYCMYCSTGRTRR
jgi:hypothetical protein